jgi:RimJ/RimL family protein N-acetyltransferase
VKDTPRYLFYRADAPSRLATLPEGYSYELWRPSLFKPVPKGMQQNHLRFVARSVLHAAHVFSNRDCGILIIRRVSDIVHYSAVAPAWFRWPFMSRDDLQIGDTWTAQHTRRQGLALFSLLTIMATLRKPGRKFWYFCREDNLASIHVAEMAGMEIAGRGGCFPVMRLKMLRQYRMTEPRVPQLNPTWPTASTTKPGAQR